MKISVIGSGYVGLVAAACFAELGHEVVCVDQDRKKVEALKRGEVPIHEEFLPELLDRHRGRKVGFSSDLPQAVEAAQIIFIAVGTPASETGEADLSAVEAVARELAGCVHDFKLIVEKSTVPVCTNQRIREVMWRNGAPGDCFDVASNPEFLREGSAVTDFLYPDRIVIGADSLPAAALLRSIYEPLTSGSYYLQKNAIPAPDTSRVPPQLIETSAESAELIKHASNAFLAMKISFINAVSGICESVGADIIQVCKGIGSDSRIGDRFLKPGIGYGGSCFPKDLAAFRSVARDCGQDFTLLSEVSRINQRQRERFVQKIRNTLWTLRGKTLAVLGLAFKGGTDDVRESPALEIIRMLLKEGCHLVAYDPAAMERTSELISSPFLEFAENAYEAAQNVDAILVLTDWEEFAELDLERLAEGMHYPIMIDGRNLFTPEQMSNAGFLYVSMGRAPVMPSPRERGQRSSFMKKAS